MPDTDLVYKITTAGLWERAQGEGVVPRSPIDRADGFMHLSTAEQLAETLRLHFSGLFNLVVLAVPAASLGEALQWEPSRGGALFPHLYDELPLDKVETVYENIAVGEDGPVGLPDMLA